MNVKENLPSAIPEAVWRRFHRDQARRERLGLLRRGVIRPAHLMQPQMMVKNAQGDWTPGLKGVNY